MQYQIITQFRYDIIEGTNNKGAPVCNLAVTLDKSDFKIFKQTIFRNGDPNPIDFQSGVSNVIQVISDSWANLQTTVNQAITLIKAEIVSAHSSADIANMPNDNFETSTDGNTWS